MSKSKERSSGQNVNLLTNQTSSQRKLGSEAYIAKLQAFVKGKRIHFSVFAGHRLYDKFINIWLLLIKIRFTQHT